MPLASYLRVCPVCDAQVLWVTNQDPPGEWFVHVMEAAAVGEGEWQVIEATHPANDSDNMPIGDFPMSREHVGDWNLHEHQVTP